MAEESRLPQAPDIDHRISRLLDEPEASPPDDAEWPTNDHERAADLLLLHALLQQLFDSNPAATRRRINAVVAEIAAETGSAGTRIVLSRRQTGRWHYAMRWWPTLASVVALIVIGGLWLTWAPKSEAYAAVQQAQRAALENVDRVYQVEIQFGGPLKARRQATLFVRGGQRFALQHPAPRVGAFWLGSNGRQYWFVLPGGRALVREDGRRIEQWLTSADAEMPFLQTTTILSRLERHYDLEFASRRPIEDEPSLWHYVRGVRQEDEKFGPDVIELWAQPDTGVAQRLVLQWNVASAIPSLKQITLNLVATKRLADDFYEPDHHAHDEVLIGTPDDEP